MNRLGSEFLQEIDGFERGIIGPLTGRQAIMMVGVILSVILAVVIVLLGLPDILLYLAILLIMPPFVLYGMKLDERIKEFLLFSFTIQERSYMTEFDREEMSDYRFTQEKGVHEWDSWQADS